jgi:hypothetical protein
MSNEHKNEIDRIKADYKSLSKKYGLPGWTELEENFDISKALIDGGELILKDVRRKINEKIMAYIHIFETFINPQTAPMFVLISIKTLDEKKWEKVKGVYKELTRIQFKQILADTDYSEHGEAELIREMYTIWEKEKKVIKEVIEGMDREYGADSPISKTNYFG